MAWRPQGMKQVAEGSFCFPLRVLECPRRLVPSPGLCPLAHLPAKSRQELILPPGGRIICSLRLGGECGPSAGGADGGE